MRDRAKKQSKKWLIGLIVVAVLLFGTVAVTIWVSSNSEKLSEYATAQDKLASRDEAAREAIHTAEDLEPDLQSAVEEALTQATHVLEAAAPGRLSFNITTRTIEIEDVYEALAEPAYRLEQAIEHRQSYTEASAAAQDALAEAGSVLTETKDKILNSDSYSDLQEGVDELKALLEDVPAAASGQQHMTTAENLRKLQDALTPSIEAVVASHEEWEKAEQEAERAAQQAAEEAAQRDPANYKSVSARDWQLIERDPDSFEGEKYVIYGVVTQADTATGDFAIRVNTGATQQSRRYNYDVNTMVRAGLLDVFDDVVRDDHVKMLVEVSGSMTYDTSVGGTATAVMVRAYGVEVIGQF